MISFATSVRIERPTKEVFAYVAEPCNFPRWNSAVQAVHKNPATDADIGATYYMERNLPSGAATNELKLVSGKPQTEFTIRTLSGPTPFTYRFRFSPYDQTTLVLLDAEVDLGGAADLFAPLVRRAVQRGVDENLATLKAILEAQATHK